MKHNYTHIAVVLDRSGSMSTVVNDTIGGFNTFLADQRSATGEATITLAQFDDQYEVIYANKPIVEAPDLTKETFVPRGMTALLDGIGRTINSTGAYLGNLPEDQRPEKVVFVILTDGGENSSREFTRGKVFEMITHQREKYDWQFVFLGANQDAISTGGLLGIAANASMTYAANGVGTKAAFASTSASLRSLRSGDADQMSYSDADREQQAQAGA